MGGVDVNQAGAVCASDQLIIRHLNVKKEVNPDSTFASADLL